MGAIQWEISTRQYDLFLKSEATLLVVGDEGGAADSEEPPLCCRGQTLDLMIRLEGASSSSSTSESRGLASTSVGASLFPPSLSVELEVSQIVSPFAPGVPSEPQAADEEALPDAKKVLVRTNGIAHLVEEKDQGGTLSASYSFQSHTKIPPRTVGSPLMLEAIMIVSEVERLGITTRVESPTTLVKQLELLCDASRFVSSSGHSKVAKCPLLTVDPLSISTRHVMLGNYGVALSVEVGNVHPRDSLRLVDLEAHVDATARAAADSAQDMNQALAIPQSENGLTLASHFQAVWSGEAPSLHLGGTAEVVIPPGHVHSFVLSLWPRKCVPPPEAAGLLQTPISVTWALGATTTTHVHAAKWQLSKPSSVQDIAGVLIRVEGPSQARLKQPFNVSVLVRNLADAPRNLVLEFTAGGSKENVCLPLQGPSKSEKQQPLLQRRQWNFGGGDLVPLISSHPLGRLDSGDEVSISVQLLPLATGVLRLRGLRLLDHLSGDTFHASSEDYCVYCWPSRVS